MALVGNRMNRPNADGSQRGDGMKHGDELLNVRWLDSGGLVHQADEDCNMTLCELDKRFDTYLLHWPIVCATTERVTCVMCMGYPTWPSYPID